MAHITTPFTDPKYFQQWRIGIISVGHQHEIPATGNRVHLYQSGHFAGSFTIPYQAARLSQDDTKLSQLDVQRWINTLNGGYNTSDLYIDEPTITTPMGWNPTVGDRSISDTFLEFTITEPSGTGNQSTRVAGDLFKMGSPARTYQLISLTTSSGVDTWKAAPGVLPMGSSPQPAPCSSIKFRMLNHQDQLRTQSVRGDWRVEWIEAVE